jgi:hypothetical protein
MFVKRDAMKEFLVHGDVSPNQSTLPTAEASILKNCGNCVPHHAAQAAAIRYGSRGPICTAADPIGVPMNAITDSGRTPSQSRSNNNQPPQKHHPYIQGLAPSVFSCLTRVCGNEVGDFPDSENDDDEEENPSQGFYMNPLLSDEPWKIRACTDDYQSPVLDNEDDSDVTVPPSGLANEDVENHHGLHWNRDGVLVLEERQNKIYFDHGRLKPEYVNNFAQHLLIPLCLFSSWYTEKSLRVNWMRTQKSSLTFNWK